MSSSPQREERARALATVAAEVGNLTPSQIEGLAQLFLTFAEMEIALLEPLPRRKPFGGDARNAAAHD